MPEEVIYSVSEILEAHDKATKKGATFKEKKAMLSYFDKRECRIGLITNEDRVKHAHNLESVRKSRIDLLDNIKKYWMDYFKKVTDKDSE